MAPTYRNIATLAGANGSSAVISKPTGVADDDVMLALIHIEGGSRTVTAPSGWVKIDERSQGDFTDYLYWKRAASEAMRKSAATAISHPAPIAGPLTAAMTGLSMPRIARGRRWKVP